MPQPVIRSECLMGMLAHLVVMPACDHCFDVVFQNAQVAGAAGQLATAVDVAPSHVTSTTACVTASPYVGHCTCLRSILPRRQATEISTVAAAAVEMRSEGARCESERGWPDTNRSSCPTVDVVMLLLLLLVPSIISSSSALVAQGRLQHNMTWATTHEKRTVAINTMPKDKRYVKYLFLFQSTCLTAIMSLLSTIPCRAPSKVADERLKLSPDGSALVRSNAPILPIVSSVCTWEVRPASRLQSK